MMTREASNLLGIDNGRVERTGRVEQDGTRTTRSEQMVNYVGIINSAMD